MPAIAQQTKTDPLTVFMAGALASETTRPVPLVSTSFDISIDAGLAIVSTKRVFRNEELNSIEATIVFPVPVHATLFALEARVDGRILKARAQRRAGAREMYEDAMERGKAAVLHEEVLRGVHMLSIGHIAPATQVEVLTTWATTLTVVGGLGQLRIPLTVGDIYGRSCLPDSDDLTHGGPIQTADLTVRCSDGTVELVGGRLDEGRSQVVLNAPIDLAVTQWKPRDLRGRAADGREVVLRIEPRLAGEEPLSVAILIDHSGSMGQPCSGDGRAMTKHQSVTAGLRAIADGLGDLDAVDLWEFDNSLTHIGSTVGGEPRGRFLALTDRLSGPAGGTEIGGALAGVVEHPAARDVLLITDGKSHALDVQALARSGRRISVVLVGEDSLEANVGHLATLTGGDIFVVASTELQDAMAAAIGTLRRPCQRPASMTGKPREVKTDRANAILLASWQPSAEPIEDTALARGVAAVAASLALPALDTEAATALAEAEGLVTYLTSLVLVDEAAEAQEGIPATRKIALPTPRTAQMPMRAESGVAAAACFSSHPEPSSSERQLWRAGLDQMTRQLAAERDEALDQLMRRIATIEKLYEHGAVPRMSRLGSQIDWDVSPNQLIAGDLSAVEPVAARLIEIAATIPEVVDLAQQMNLDAVRLIVALVARAHSSKSRSAARVARAILGAKTSVEIEALSRRLGLDSRHGPNAATQIPSTDATPE